MVKFRTAVLGLTAGAVVAFVATGADANGRRSIKDEPRSAPFSWTGFYIGAHVGAGSSDTEYDLIQNAQKFDISGDGLFGGGYLGYNYQLSSNLVAGVEVEGSFANISRSGLECTIAQTALCSTDVNSFGSVRGRLGLALNNLLFYAAGGWAFANVDFDRKFQPGGVPFTAGVSESRSGWVVGIGAEVAIDRNWSFRIQYDHYDFGTETHNVPALSNVSDTRVSLDVDTVRLGISFRP